MARTYAGVLGYLGLAVTLLRGALHCGGLEGTLMQALIAMAVLAPVGAVVGAVAEQTVDESVRESLQERLAELENAGAAKA